jgi:alpha-tubulin suppressor-like RCC1 family protein
MSRDNWPAGIRGVIHSYEGRIIMVSMNYDASVTHVWKKCYRQVTLILMLLLVSLPVSALAATPWYAHGKSHTLTLTKNGTVWALGDNSHGQIGNGMSGGKVLEPVTVKGLDGIIAVQAGTNHSVALKKDGTVWTWGSNSSGQLGNGTTQNSSVPNRVAGVSDITAIASGSGHVVALKRDGTVWAWGGNHSGQIGNGEYQDCKTPVQVVGLLDITAITAGAFNTVALNKDGSVMAWGFNGKGQLGNGGNERSNVPVIVSGLDNVLAIAAGDSHVSALKSDGSVWAWGNNLDSQLGRTNISYSSLPMQIQGITNIDDITASVGHTLAIAENNVVWGWGDTESGEWGNGLSLDGSAHPVPVTGYNGYVSVAAVVNPDTVLRDRIEDTGLQADVGSNGTVRSKGVIPAAFVTASR